MLRLPYLDKGNNMKENKNKARRKYDLIEGIQRAYSKNKTLSVQGAPNSRGHMLHQHRPQPERPGSVTDYFSTPSNGEL